MAQGGEFAFVLYAAALAVGLISPTDNAVLTAVIIVSMILTPLFVILHDRTRRATAPDMDGIEEPDGLQGNVLLIGFGRFGQVASQPLLARGYSVSIIDTDTEMIRVAGLMGFKVFFGDGTRLDILHAAGAAEARLILICIDNADAATRIAHLVKQEFPLTPVMARAYDRGHAIALIKAGVDWQLREVFESALATGRAALEKLGEDAETIAEIEEAFRRRDAERLDMQMTGDITAGRQLLIPNWVGDRVPAAVAAVPVPAPAAAD
jgi:glutathione-regulated potassium-efflux system protein KefB